MRLLGQSDCHVIRISPASDLSSALVYTYDGLSARKIRCRELRLICVFQTLIIEAFSFNHSRCATEKLGRTLIRDQGRSRDDQPRAFTRVARSTQLEPAGRRVTQISQNGTTGAAALEAPQKVRAASAMLKMEIPGRLARE